MAKNNLRAVLLAGGVGTRLRPLTVVFPKPLVPLGESPIIEILLKKLKNSGIEDVTISTGYLSELIRAVCGDGSRFGLDISYSHEESPLGTAGPLGLMDLGDGDVVVMNGDLLTTMNFSRMYEYHRAQNADITIGTFRRTIKMDFGVVLSSESGGFEGFREKPSFEHDVSMGINILSSRAREHIVANERLDMPDLILKVHESGGLVSCFKEDCYWMDIGRMEDYAQAQIDYQSNSEQFICA